MNDYRLKCDCEDGGDCSKISVCAAASIADDCKERIAELRLQISGVWEVIRDIEDTYAPDQPPIEVAEWKECLELALGNASRIPDLFEELS